MKKLLIPIMCIVFLGCSKKSIHPSTPVPPANILGTWHLSSDSSYTYDNGQLIKSIEQVLGPNVNNSVTYDQKGIATFIVLVKQPTVVIDTIPISYSIVGDSIFYYNGLQRGIIRQLTSTQLTLYFDISGIVNYDLGGATDSTVFQRITTVDHYTR